MDLGLVKLILGFGFCVFYVCVFIWALVDSIQNPRLKGKMKVLWIILIFFTGIGPLLYIFFRPKESQNV